MPAAGTKAPVAQLDRARIFYIRLLRVRILPGAPSNRIPRQRHRAGVSYLPSHLTPNTCKPLKGAVLLAGDFEHRTSQYPPTAVGGEG